jgi:pimeloyl-ACP methyl ester carboxylesterase
MPILFSQRFLADPARADLRKEWRQHLVSNDKVGLTRAVAGVMSREGVYESLSNVRVPTLILVGENDMATSPDKSERMHDSIPNSRMVTIPNSGHMSPIEEPEAVNAAIRDFLISLG